MTANQDDQRNTYERQVSSFHVQPHPRPPETGRLGVMEAERATGEGREGGEGKHHQRGWGEGEVHKDTETGTVARGPVEDSWSV